MRWDIGIACKMCGKVAHEDEGLCKDCFDMLQTHYGQICLKCKHYDFIEWTPANVAVLAKKLGIDYDMLIGTNMIVILPFKGCPKCMPKDEPWLNGDLPIGFDNGEHGYN
jgi:hypothetical protein